MADWGPHDMKHRRTTVPRREITRFAVRAGRRAGSGEPARWRLRVDAARSVSTVAGTDRRGGRVVYCGGLENRCGCKLTGGSNPSLSANLRSSGLSHHILDTHSRQRLRRSRVGRPVAPKHRACFGAVRLPGSVRGPYSLRFHFRRCGRNPGALRGVLISGETASENLDGTGVSARAGEVGRWPACPDTPPWKVEPAWRAGLPRGAPSHR